MNTPAPMSERQLNRVTRGTIIFVVALLLQPLLLNLALTGWDKNFSSSGSWAVFLAEPLCGLGAAALLARDLAGTVGHRVLKWLLLSICFVPASMALGVGGCLLVNYK